uniref:Mediator of RNA polymerase II transcription subunit 26 n=1 Tax=Caenorhabditis tropicalis TaxID=1561998 RepID=A0A1I7U0R4_9PELO
MNWELDQKYLRPFQNQLWNLAVKDRDVFVFLVDYFSETLYWHPTFPTISTDLVLSGMIKKYKELTDVSKLDIYLCFPYIEYHSTPLLHPAIKKLAEVLFADSKAYTTRLIRECRLVILNSNLGEGLIRIKAKHIDLICASEKKEEFLPTAYIEAAMNVQRGLNDMFHQLQFDREQLKIVGSAQNRSGGMRNSPVLGASYTCISQRPTERTVNIISKNNKSPAYQPHAPQPSIKHRKPVIFIPKEPEPEVKPSTPDKSVDMARICEIIKEQAQKHSQLMNAQLSYPCPTNPAPGEVSFDQLDPSHPNYQSPKKKRNHNKPKDPNKPKERRIFSKPELTHPVQEQTVQNPASLPITTVNTRPFISTGQDVMPGINAPYTVRMTGGRQAIMQPNPRVKQVMRQKVYEDQRLAEEEQLKQYGIEPSNSVQMKVFGRVSPMKPGQRITHRHRPYHPRKQAPKVANSNSNVVVEGTAQTVLGKLVPQQHGSFSSQKESQHPSPIFQAILVSQNSSATKKVYTLRRVEPTKQIPSVEQLRIQMSQL